MELILRIPAHTFSDIFPILNFESFHHRFEAVTEKNFAECGIENVPNEDRGTNQFCLFDKLTELTGAWIGGEDREQVQTAIFPLHQPIDAGPAHKLPIAGFGDHCVSVQDDRPEQFRRRCEVMAGPAIAILDVCHVE